MKKVIAIFIVFILCFTASISAAAAATDTYTHVDVSGNQTELRLSREAYNAVKHITASSVGLQEKLEGMTDIYCSGDGTVFILCGEKSRLVLLNPDYTLKSEITVTDNTGAALDFTGAQGVYCDDQNHIYIADTTNARILVTDIDGLLISIIKKPQSDIIPNDFTYQPVHVAKDSKGYTYILSLGCYYGSLLYDPSGEFMGFYGSNTVATSALDTLSYLWDKVTSNDTKKAASLKTLPYSFVDFDFDPDGYMVTCTSNTKTDQNGKGQISKISPNGSNILYKQNLKNGSVSSSAVNFLENKLVLQEDNTGTYRAQNIVSISVDEAGYIFALDKTNGYIYVYDSECNLMNVFGGGMESGQQLGVFQNPISLTLHGSSVLVADYQDCSVTVFDITEYGSLLFNAQSLYSKGDYDESKTQWEQVLSLDRGNQLAYRGLAMVFYNEGDYKTALEYADSALDYTVYDLAWQAIISDFMSTHFIWILCFVLLVIAGIVFSVVHTRKHKIKVIRNKKVRTLLATTFHPFRSFEDIKYYNGGSVLYAVILTALLYLVFVLKETAFGFLYTETSVHNYNAVYTVGKTVGLVLLWSVFNWLVCSMFSGKGTLKEVFIGTTYSLLPLIIFTVLRVILTNFLPLSGAGLINGLGTAVWLFTFFILCISMMIIHEYDFFKFLLTSIVTIIFMIFGVFVLFMCALLLKQCGSFVYSIYKEISYR